MKTTLIRAAFVGILALGATTAHAAEKAAAAKDDVSLKLTKGTMQAGGTVAFVIDFNAANGFSRALYSLNIAPEFGYFVIDNLELGARFQFVPTFGDTPFQGVLALDFGAKYHFKIAPRFAMYAGLLIGPGIEWVDGQGSTGRFDVELPVGVLFALNQHVALDLGFRFNLIQNFSPSSTRISIPIGYLGVQSYFEL